MADMKARYTTMQSRVCANRVVTGIRYTLKQRHRKRRCKRMLSGIGGFDLAILQSIRLFVKDLNLEMKTLMKPLTQPAHGLGKGAGMSELTEALMKAADVHKGTDLGGLLQWASLHIKEQDDALVEVRRELEDEQHERLRLENAVKTAAVQMEAALHAVRNSLPVNIDHIGRDMSGHINLMAGHGDTDYLKKSGQSIRHVDLRSVKPQKANT